jgi:hypothetical protein
VKVFDGEVAVNNRAPDGAGGSGLSEVPGPGEVQGPAEVSLEQWTQIVRSMQRITIDKKGKPSSVQAFSKNATDTWESWNEERDRAVAELFAE